MSSIIEFENIHFTYPGKSRAVLCGASLAIGPGERIGLLGKNGGGKSTLLHIGTGLLLPSSGRVLHQGRDCRAEKDFVEARKSVGYLLQNDADQLFCATVLEDVAFGPCNLGHPAAEAEEMSRAMLEELGLARLAGRNGQRLSGGERKLAALATILVMRPSLLFLDEPTNNLDEEAQELLLAVLLRYALPALVVSHDPAFLEDLCTTFLHLDNGIITPA